MLTYRELAKAIESWPDKQKDSYVMIWEPEKFNDFLVCDNPWNRVVIPSHDTDESPSPKLGHPFIIF